MELPKQNASYLTFKTSVTPAIKEKYLLSNSQLIKVQDPTIRFKTNILSLSSSPIQTWQLMQIFQENDISTHFLARYSM